MKVSVILILVCVAVLALWQNVALVAAQQTETDGSDDALAETCRHMTANLAMKSARLSSRRKKRLAPLLITAAVPIIGSVLGSLFGGNSKKEEMAAMQKQMAAQKETITKLDGQISELRDVNGQLVVKTKEQALQLLNLQDKLTETEAKSKQHMSEMTNRINAVNDAFSNYKQMSTERMNELMKANNILTDNIAEIQRVAEAKFSALNDKLDEQKAELDSFVEMIDKELGVIKETGARTVARLGDMNKQLSQVTQATLRVGEAHAMQTEELSNVSTKLDGVERKADRLVSEMTRILVETINGELTSSATTLAAKINSTFSRLQDRVKEVARQQNMTDLIRTFGTAVDHLQYLIDFKETRLRINEEGEYVPKHVAKYWAHMVLNPNISALGIDRILEKLNQLAAGTNTGNPLEDHPSIYEIYRDGVSQFISDFKKRAIFSAESRQAIESATPTQSEFYYLQMMENQVQELLTNGSSLSGIAKIILAQDNLKTALEEADLVEPTLTEAEADEADLVFTTTTPSAANTDPIPESEDPAVQALLASILGQTYTRKRRSTDNVEVRFSLEQQIQRNRIIADQVIETRQLAITQCVEHLKRVQQQRQVFKAYSPALSPLYTNEPVFFMFKSANGTQEIGFSGRTLVPIQNRKIRSERLVIAANCSAGVVATEETALKCYQVVSGCRLCLDCSPAAPRSRDRVNMQCTFRDATLTDFIGADASRVRNRPYPMTDAEMATAERAGSVPANAFASNDSSWLTRNVQAMNDLVLDRTYSGPIRLLAYNETAIYAITGMLEVDDKETQTICGVNVGQPRSFDYNLVAIGAAALTIDVCEKATGKWLYVKEIPKSNTQAFRARFKVARVNHIFTGWIRPEPAAWVHGIGFFPTGFNGDTLTLRLYTTLY